MERSILSCPRQSKGTALVQAFLVPCCCETTFVKLAVGVGERGIVVVEPSRDARVARFLTLHSFGRVNLEVFQEELSCSYTRTL